MREPPPPPPLLLELGGALDERDGPTDEAGGDDGALRDGAGAGDGREIEGLEAGGEYEGRADGAIVGGDMAGVRMAGDSERDGATDGAITGRLLLRGLSLRKLFGAVAGRLASVDGPREGVMVGAFPIEGGCSVRSGAATVWRGTELSERVVF